MAIGDKLKKKGKAVKEKASQAIIKAKGKVDDYARVSDWHKHEKLKYKNRKETIRESGKIRKKGESYEACAKRFYAQGDRDGVHKACKLPGEYKKPSKPTRKTSKFKMKSTDFENRYPGKLPKMERKGKEERKE